MRQTARSQIGPSTPAIPPSNAANDPDRPPTAAPFASRSFAATSTALTQTEDASHPVPCSKSFVVHGMTTVVRFRLRQVAGGLHVEREEHPASGGRSLQVVRFRDLHGFKRWCDHDTLRFDAPLGHACLLRSGEELWGRDD